MCACHRTSPTATLLACDGLYSATAAEQRGLHRTKLMTFAACHRGSGATAACLTKRWHTRPMAATVRELEPARLYVRPAVTPRQTKTLPSAPKLMSLKLGTTQRRSPPAHERSAGAAAAPRERRVFSASEGGFKTTDALSDQAT
jgi:hypothetical protein